MAKALSKLWLHLAVQSGCCHPQGRPVNVKHDARCVMGKVGERQKNPKRGKFLIYCYKFAKTYFL